jgi:hypothetical protein
VADAVDGDADGFRGGGGEGDGGEEVTAGEHLTEEISEPEGRAPAGRDAGKRMHPLRPEARGRFLRKRAGPSVCWGQAL